MKLKRTEAAGRFLSCVGRFYGRSGDFELLRVKIKELNSVFVQLRFLRRTSHFWSVASQTSGIRFGTRL